MKKNETTIGVYSGEEVILTKYDDSLVIHSPDMCVKFEPNMVLYSVANTNYEVAKSLHIYNLNDPNFHMTLFVNCEDIERLIDWFRESGVKKRSMSCGKTRSEEE